MQRKCSGTKGFHSKNAERIPKYKKYSCNHLCKDAEENKTKEVCEQQYVREDNETNMLKNKMTIEHMNLHYGDFHALKDINLHIKPGEVHVLFGPNGTGKSTLIGAIMGFNRYEILEGKIYFKGQDITDMSCDERARLGVGVMIQRPPTIRGLSLRKMVEICGATSEEAETMAKWMGLDNFLDRSVNDGFSGGELKRCELLQLMAQNPDLLLLDEPESGVDLENIALVGKAVNYILHTEPCGGAGCDKPCCIKNQGWENCNPLESKADLFCALLSA